MTATLRWFHRCLVVIPNKRYRCQFPKCGKEFDLAGAIEHAIASQPDLTREA